MSFANRWHQLVQSDHRNIYKMYVAVAYSLLNSSELGVTYWVVSRKR